MSSGSGFGPNPWQQTSWDWRAAGNFICGGAGTGLLLITAVFATPAQTKLVWLMVLGLALVGLGLLCVWLEIGRPWRALNVFFNPRTSWMSREAYVGLVLFPVGLAAILGWNAGAWATAALAAAFLYCQSRMLPAARGIPVWRSVWFSPFMLLTACCEGLGIFSLLGWLDVPVSTTFVLAFAVLLALRMLVWQRYRASVDESLAPPARQVLEQTGVLLAYGSLAPLILLLGGWLLPIALQSVLMGLAGVWAAGAGAVAKYRLVTRASYNQGFALAKIPVRGVRNAG